MYAVHEKREIIPNRTNNICCFQRNNKREIVVIFRGKANFDRGKIE